MQTYRLLLVEDEPDLLETFESEFKATGEYRVTVATNGLEAYQKARNQQFDVIVTDFRMPKINGVDLIRSLRDQNYNSATPILVLTGYIAEARSECAKAHLSRHLAFAEKPIPIQDLLALVRELVLGAGSAQPEAPKPPHKVDVEFVNPFISAVILTLQTLGQQAHVEKQAPYVLKKGEKLGVDVCGTIAMNSTGFTGTLCLAMPASTFLPIVSKMLGETFSELTPEILDAAAEMINIIYGQTKRELNEKGYQLQRALPSVIRGGDLHISSDGAFPTLAIPFVTESGPVYALICVDQDLSKHS